MCRCVLIDRGPAPPDYAETRAELRSMLGVEPVPNPTYFRGVEFFWAEDGCLCPCDFQLTAAAAGMVATLEHGDVRFTPGATRGTEEDR